MTDQPRPASQPATKAGRDFLYGDEPLTEEGLLNAILAIEAEAASAAIWERLEGQPGFSEELAEGEAQIAAGKGTPLSEIRRQEAAAPTPARESEAVDVLREMLAGGVVIDIPGKYVEMQHDHRTLEWARALLARSAASGEEGE